MISPFVKHFIFHPADNRSFNFLPGQFITIHFDHNGKTLRRSYSIANAPQDNNRIEFAAGFVAQGPGTDLLFNLQPGDTININGPFGRLILKENIPGRYILVATSTGVTPYRAMLEQLKQMINLHPNLHVVVLLGVQTRKDAIYVEEFLAFMDYSPRLSFQLFLSRETEENLMPHERVGYVQSAFPHLNLQPDHDMVYLCGNPSMIDDAYTYLNNVGFSTQRIVREKYISSK